MTRDELINAGQALFGERWQTPLARALGVTDRTMRRWVSGKQPIPDGLEADLRRLLKERRDQIGRLLRASAA